MKLAGGYRRVSLQIWRNPAFRQLRKQSRDAAEFLFYAITCPHSNLIGLFCLPLEYAAADLDWPIGRVRTALRTLRKAGFIDYDDEGKVVWVPQILEGQNLQNRSQAEGAVKQLDALPSTPLVAKLKEKISPDFDRRGKAGEAIMEPLARWFGGSVGDTVPPTVSPVSPNGASTVPTTEAVAVTEAVSDTEAGAEAVPVPNGKDRLFSFTHTNGPPQTFAEKYTDKLLRLTGEHHSRDLWLRRFRDVPEAVVVNAVEELERAVDRKRIENPGAYFQVIYERHAAYHSEPVSEETV